MLTKKQILDADDILTETVKTPEWGGDVIVRGLNGEERAAFEQSITDDDGKVVLIGAKEKLIVHCVIDKDGERVFSDSDAELLKKKNGAVIQRVYAKCADLSGLSKEESEKISKN
jgi:hypothetical protein